MPEVSDGRVTHETKLDFQPLFICHFEALASLNILRLVLTLGPAAAESGRLLDVLPATVAGAGRTCVVTL